MIRRPIDRSAGAEGILRQLDDGLTLLCQRHSIEAVGVGFGGPVDVAQGRAITSHQVPGWDGFPLAEWFSQACSAPTFIGNDCNVAALAEASLGAGRGTRRVLYVTVGTGIGGGLVVDGAIDGEERPAVAEIGHLRPGLQARSSGETVESLASGLGMEQQMLRALAQPDEWDVSPATVLQLREFALPATAAIPTSAIAAAAAAGNVLALRILQQGTRHWVGPWRRQRP